MSIAGAFVALLMTGRDLTMPSNIGLIMLMGVVTKNSILLVDYAIVARRQGKSRFEALIDACHKRSQPIVMTTIAMGAGMLPLASGLHALQDALAHYARSDGHRRLAFAAASLINL